MLIENSQTGEQITTDRGYFSTLGAIIKAGLTYNTLEAFKSALETAEPNLPQINICKTVDPVTGLPNLPYCIVWDIKITELPF